MRQAPQEAIKRCSSHVVQRAIYGNPPQRFTVQDISVMRPAGVHRELCQRVWPAADNDAVVRRPLVAEVGPELFPSTLRDVPPAISQPALTGTPIEPATTGKPLTTLSGHYRLLVVQPGTKHSATQVRHEPLANYCALHDVAVGIAGCNHGER
jgi:hypothetical protein